MDFRRLEVFTKVFQEKSFSKAGKHLYLSQPTISEHIRLLEEDLGLTLFDRQGKEIFPTQAGQFLYPYANQLMILKRDALRAMEQFRDKGQGELLIGGSNIPGQYILPRFLGFFKKKFPEIKIRMWIGDTQSIEEKVLDGIVELGLVGALIEHRRIACQPFTTDELICVAPPSFAGASQKEIKPEELLSLPFILREKGSGTRKSIEQAFKKIRLDLKNLPVVAEMGSNEAIRQAVKAGLGVSIISRRTVQEELELGRLQEIKIRRFPLIRNFYLLTLKQRTLSPLAQEFKSFILEKENNHGGKSSA